MILVQVQFKGFYATQKKGFNWWDRFQFTALQIALAVRFVIRQLLRGRIVTEITWNVSIRHRGRTKIKALAYTKA